MAGNFSSQLATGLHLLLEVSPLEAETLVFALQNPDLRGGLTLALRHPEDQVRAQLGTVSWGSIASED